MLWFPLLLLFKRMPLPVLAAPVMTPLGNNNSSSGSSNGYGYGYGGSGSTGSYGTSTDTSTVSTVTGTDGNDYLVGEEGYDPETIWEA